MSDIHIMLLLAVPLAAALLLAGIFADAFPLQLPPVPKERIYEDHETPESD